MNLNEKEAYLAMFEFLASLYERTRSDELGALLGGMSLLEDGVTADPAVWQDWMQSVQKAKQGGVDASLGIASQEGLSEEL